MSTKGILSVVIASTAILTGLASYSSAVFSTKIEQKISEKNSIQGIDASIIDRSNGFFTRKQTYKIVLSPDYLSQEYNINSAREPVEMFIPHNFTAYPLYIVSDFRLDMAHGSILKFLSETKLNNIPHTASVHTNIILGSSDIAIEITPKTYQLEEIEISYQGVELTATTDLEFIEGEFDFNIADFNLVLDGQGNFNLDGLTVKSSFETIDDVMVINQSDALVKSISFKDESKNIAIEAKDINTTSSVSFVDQKLALIADFTVSSITMNDPSVSYTVKDSIMEFSLSDINQDAYLELEKVSRQLNPAPEQMSQVLMELVSAGGKGNISKFNFNINEVQFDSNAEFSLAPYQGTAIADELNQHVAQNFQLTSQLNLSNNYAEIFAQFQPMIEHFTQSGYATVDSEGNISSKLSFENGQLTANETVIGM